MIFFLPQTDNALRNDNILHCSRLHPFVQEIASNSPIIRVLFESMNGTHVCDFCCGEQTRIGIGWKAVAMDDVGGKVAHELS